MTVVDSKGTRHLHALDDTRPTADGLYQRVGTGSYHFAAGGGNVLVETARKGVLTAGTVRVDRVMLVCASSSEGRYQQQ